MEPPNDLLPVFQYRNWSVDNYPLGFDGDNESPQIDDLVQGSDEATSALQKQNSFPSSGEVQQLAPSDEPWNPLTGSRRAYYGNGVSPTYKVSSHAIYQLDAPSTYYTATSEMMTSEAFHSAMSHVGDYQNDVPADPTV